MTGMGGMLSEEELSQLAMSSGKAFDRKFMTGMIEHHLGAIEMVNIIKNSKVAEIRAFADAIIKTQSAEVELMNKLLAKI
jgi:uncharacterized protein (DUF305 family)